MSMSREGRAHVLMQMVRLLLGTLLCATFHAPPANSQQPRPQDGSSPPVVESPAFVHAAASVDNSTPDSNHAIPSGTILPVRLNVSLSSEKSKKGRVLTARIMQDIPLSPGVTLKQGSKVLGHIVEVTPATTGAPARICLQFDKLVSSHQTISITTNLRAIAGFMKVLEAQTPPSGAGESDVSIWLTTVQVGGDVVYGQGGPVTSGDGTNEVVGKSLYGGGVVVKVRAKQGTKCRGAIDGNDRPQALWVFSSDACGTYGLDDIRIAHAGRSDPSGVIVLASSSGSLKLASGAGMLLRVTREPIVTGK